MLRSDLACKFAVCAYDTGYDMDYLLDIVDEAIADGECEVDAINEVIDMAYEFDI